MVIQTERHNCEEVVGTARATIIILKGGGQRQLFQRVHSIVQIHYVYTIILSTFTQTFVI